MSSDPRQTDGRAPTAGAARDPAVIAQVKDFFGRIIDAEEDGTGDEAARSALAAAPAPVREAVEGLLAARRRAGDLLVETRSGATASPPMPAADAPAGEPPVRIDGYEIGDEIGRGGFGVVFRARQLRPVERPVAIKLLRSDLASPETIRRFRGEARLLARMDHPGIARVLDAGADAVGRPFVAMELVDGQPLIEFCDGRGLSVRARVELMAEVCRAVQHAHQRAVIHRDLKPSNVLVEQADGRPRIRIIDFGIARLLDDGMGESVTQTGARLGTPRYMSPEQLHAGDPGDVRSDVFALGVVLCELLTNSVPHRATERAAAGGTRTAPTSRLTRPSSLAAAGPPAIALRSSELKGDLDRIVLKAVATEPDQRYPSAAAMGQDLERYLAGLPVLAAPPSVWYSTRKLIRRHKAASAAVVLAALSLVGGSVAALYGLDRATDARNEAQAAFARADRDRRSAETITEFLLVDMIAASNPDLNQGGETSIRQLLRRASGEAAMRFAENPDLLVSLYERLGAAQRALTDFDSAERTFLRAAEACERTLGASDRRCMTLRLEAILAALSTGRGEDQSGAISSLLETARDRFGDQDALSLRIRLHAAHIRAEGNWLEEMRAVEQACRESALAETEQHLEALQLLGNALRITGDPEALTLLKRATEMADRVHGRERFAAVAIRLTHAQALLDARRFDEARGAFAEILATSERIHGAESMFARLAMLNLSRISRLQGRPAEGAEHARRFFETTVRADGAESMWAGVAQFELALHEALAGDLEQSRRRFEESLRIRLAYAPADDPSSLLRRMEYAQTLVDAGHAEAARTVAQTVLDLAAPGTSPHVQATIVFARLDAAAKGLGAARAGVQAQLARITAGDGDAARARAMLADWLAANPE